MKRAILAWMLLAVVGGATPAFAEKTAVESHLTNPMLLMMAGVQPFYDDKEWNPLPDARWENHVVRIRRVWLESNECGTRPASCPRQQLAILIMRPNLSTERNLYLLPASYGWGYPEIVHYPEPTDTEGFFILEIQEATINKNAIENNRSTWFHIRKRKVFFNLQEAYLDEQMDDWVKVGGPDGRW